MEYTYLALAVRVYGCVKEPAKMYFCFILICIRSLANCRQPALYLYSACLFWPMKSVESIKLPTCQRLL